MSETKRAYDPAFLEWWRKNAALTANAIDYAAQAWEEATRQVKTDCAAAHSEETAIRNELLRALRRAETFINLGVEYGWIQMPADPAHVTAGTLEDIRAALENAKGPA